jgi:hypothetical protein
MQQWFTPVAVSLEGFKGTTLPSNIDLSGCMILLAGEIQLPSGLLDGSQQPSALGFPLAGGAANNLELLWVDFKCTDSAEWLARAKKLVVLTAGQVRDQNLLTPVTEQVVWLNFNAQ